MAKGIWLPTKCRTTVDDGFVAADVKARESFVWWSSPFESRDPQNCGEEERKERRWMFTKMVL